MKPKRVQRRRAKGWRLPENTVCVDRSTKWGNPFIVGKHGTQAECVDLYKKLLGGHLCITIDNTQQQEIVIRHVIKNLHRLRGKNLACWCREGTPCHADILLEIANQ